MSEWKMVPVTATIEMKRAAVVYANGNAVYKNVAAEVLAIEEGIYGECYEAMLAAAPPAPTSTPVEDESDPVALWAEIHRLRDAVKGPDGYETWQQAAFAERERRVKAEKAPLAPTSTQYPLPDDLYDSKDWRAGSYAERVEWLHTMYENARTTLDTYLAMKATPSAEPTTECTTCGAIVVGVAEPSEPVAWYVQRVAPGMRDDGKRLGPWWRRADAEEFVDERHVLRELHTHPAPADPTAACVEAMRMAVEALDTVLERIGPYWDVVEARKVLRAQIEQIGGGR